MKSCYLYIIVCLLLLSSCKRSLLVDNSDVLVAVKDRILTRSEVENLVPRGASSADSLLITENYIKKWIKDALVYEVAVQNLTSEKAAIDKLVEEYRNSLTRYRYEERLLKERLSVNIREIEKLTYFDEHRDKFILDKNLIKGLFLKVPADAPGLSEVKGWDKTNTEASLEKIEKYSIQNAVIYEYFYDRWVDFSDIMDNIPIHLPDPTAYLRTNKTVEFADSSFCYMLNIQEFLPAGSVAPYDYAESQIVEMLTNQKKVEFLRSFEEELYNDAIRRGHVVFNREP